MKKLVLLAFSIILSACGVESVDTTFEANKNNKLLELRTLSSQDKQAIYQDFYKTNQTAFGELSEYKVTSCLSDNVQSKSDEFTLEEVANWCKSAFLQGRNFSKYKHYDFDDLQTVEVFSFDDLQSTIRQYFVKEGGDFYAAHFTSDGRRLLLGVGNVKNVTAESLATICQALTKESLGVAIEGLVLETYQLFDLNELTSGKNFAIKPAVASKCLPATQ